jgi:hypothetical protein
MESCKEYIQGFSRSTLHGGIAFWRDAQCAFEGVNPEMHGSKVALNDDVQTT